MQERIIFAGTPDFAVTHLEALINAGANIVAVYTQPDRPAGRGHKLTQTPVKSLALAHNIPVYTPLNFKEESDLATFESHKADLAIVVAYGLLLPQRILDAPRLGCINVHASLLPQWRGAAPIQRALLSGQKTTGVSIMQLVQKLDAGDVLCTSKLDIQDTDTSLTLFERLAQNGAQCLVDNLEAILNGKLPPQKQDEALVTYAAKLSKDESPLDFNRSAHELDLQVRGLNPWPIATATLEQTVYKIFEAKALTETEINSYLSQPQDLTSLKNGAIIDICHDGILVKCAQGCLLIKVMQAPGKGRVQAVDFARSKKELFVRGKSFD